MIGWTHHPAGAAFPSHAADWDRLNVRLFDGHPLFDSRFVGALLTHFGAGNELLCLHRGADGVDGALVLCPRGFGRWTLFLPAQAPIGPVLVGDGRLLATLLPALPGYAWSLELLALDPEYMPHWDGLALPRWTLSHHRTIAVSLTGSFEDYLRRRPKTLAQNLRRYRQRAVGAFDAVEFRPLSAPEDMLAGVARFAAIESAGWKGRAGSAVGMDNSQGRFYVDLLTGFSASGQAQVAELRFGPRVVASRLIIRNRQLDVFLKTAYDESLKPFAPGRLLLAEVLKAAFGHPARRRVEFYTNATRDQVQWADSARSTRHETLFRRPWIAAFTVLLRSARRPTGAAPVRTETEREAGEVGEAALCRSLDRLPSDCRALLERAEDNSYEFGPTWFRNLHDGVFAADDGVRYATLTDGRHALAVMPIRLVRQGRVRSIESLSNYYTSLYSPAVVEGAASGELVRLVGAAIGALGPADMARFAPMAPDAPTYQALLSAFMSNGWVPFRYFCFGNWYLKSPGNWEHYLKSRTANLRSTIKRATRKLVDAGGRLELVSGTNGLDDAVAAFQRVYAKSWKLPEPFPDFVPGLIGALAGAGKLRLGIAWLGDQPIAAQLWIVNGGRACIVKVAYDEGHATYSPGTVLTAFLMRHVLDIDRVAEVDFQIGDDPYKRLWMSHRRERWGIVAYNPRTPLGLLLLLREVAGRALKRLYTGAAGWIRSRTPRLGKASPVAGSATDASDAPRPAA